MRDRYDRKEIPETQVDLIPLMNLTTLLIPLLLMGATFVSLATIDTTIPAISDEPPPCHDCEDDLLLSVLITDQGLTIAGADAVLNPEGVEADGPTLPCEGACTNDAYDYEGLTSLLSQVKDEHPDHQDVILVPEERVPYEVIIHVLDAAREDTSIQPDGAPRELFPRAVLAGGAM